MRVVHSLVCVCVCVFVQIDVAVKVASVLKFRADEFNKRLQADEELVRMAEEGIEDTDGKASIPAAISHVTNVVRTLFECNEQGEGRISGEKDGEMS